MDTLTKFERALFAEFESLADARDLGESLGRYGRTAVESVRSFFGADRDATKETDRAGRTLERCDVGVERTVAANAELDRAGERVAARTRELERERAHTRERDSGYGWGL